MSWTAPMTWVAGDFLSAGQLNEQLRDNMLEMAAAKASKPAQLLVANGDKQVELGSWIRQTVGNSANETTTSTTYTDLATAGPAVSVGCRTKVAVWISAQIRNDVAAREAWMSFACSGATTSAAIDGRALLVQHSTAATDFRGSVMTLFDVNPGSNTFTAKYRTDTAGGTASFVRRQIAVLAL